MFPIITLHLNIDSFLAAYPPPPDTLPAPFKAPGFLSYRASPALPAKGYKFP